MKKLSYILLIVLTVPLLAMECEEPNIEEPPLELPAITQQGANTFGCLINGEVWVPLGLRGTSGIRAFYQKATVLSIDTRNISDELRGIIEITARSQSADFESFSFDLNDTLDTRLAFEIGGCYIDNYPDPSQVIAGQVTIDRLNLGSFVAGQFWFIAVTPECDTLRVTDGRFDVKLL